MASIRRLLAAVAGLAVAFLFVMVVQSLAPEPGLHEGAGDVRFERFAFTTPEERFTVGSTARLVNAGPVVATFVVVDPSGAETRVTTGPGKQTNLTLPVEGTYTVTTEEWPWAEQEWVVRSANPFTRFLEDLF